jgi:hypothetical protein
VAIIAALLVLIDVFLSQLNGNTGEATTGLSSIFSGIGSTLVGWAAILTAFALLLGFGNVVSVHWNRVYTRKPGAIYSIVLLLALFITLLIGIVEYYFDAPLFITFEDIFDFVLQPLEATLFSLLAFFIATAAFRAFRVRNLETVVFVLFALIVLLGQVPIGIYLWPELPIIKDWILNVPTLAGVRGILLGVALGTIATGLRVLIGAERPYTD